MKVDKVIWIKIEDIKKGNIEIDVYALKKSGVKYILSHRPKKNIFKLSVSSCYGQYYLIVANNDLMTIVDANTKKAVINERTTVGNIYCFSKILEIKKSNKLTITLEKPGDGISVAYKMRNNLIKEDGTISNVIKSSPNSEETNSYPAFNYLSNILYYSIRDAEIRKKFLVLTKGKCLVEGFYNLATNPFRNVKKIYELISDRKAIYEPALNTIRLPSWKTTSIPNQWTLAIKFNDSGSKNFIIGGPGLVVFDKDNNVWINNNVRQGTPNSSTFCTILESDGKPKSFSPLFGGGILGSGFGIAVNKKKDRIVIGNFGWGATHYNPQDGSISVVKSDGSIITPSNGYTRGFKRAQGVYYDSKGNIWISGWGSEEPLGSNDSSTFKFKGTNSSIAVYINGEPNNVATYKFPSKYYGTFDVVVDDEGNGYVSNAGNARENVRSSVYHLQLINNKLVFKNSWISNHQATNGAEVLRQITISPSNHVYVAAAGSSRVLKFNKDLYFLGELTNKMDGPWGIVFDKKNTMYVSNFRRDTRRVNNNTLDMEGMFGVTIVYNENEKTAELMTLPTGGKEIKLANGFPLYGSINKPSYEPLMRSTGSNIDKAGNLWVINNWKPALRTDLSSNPGGDGVVVFIGVAH